MNLLDSTFLIDLLRGNKRALAIAKSRETFLTTQINMYEVIRGLFLKNITSSKFTKIMELFENIRVLPFDDKAVVKSAKIYSEIRKKGLEVHNFDCIVAGIALSNGVNKIVTSNTKHFARIKDIVVVSY